MHCVTELKQDQEVCREQSSAVELQQRTDNSADTAAAGDDAAICRQTQDSQQTLKDSCERFFTQLNEARCNAGRPEDLQVTSKCM